VLSTCVEFLGIGKSSGSSKSTFNLHLVIADMLLLYFCTLYPYRSWSGTDPHFIPPYPAPCCYIISRFYFSAVGFSWANSFCFSIPGPHRV